MCKVHIIISFIPLCCRADEKINACELFQGNLVCGKSSLSSSDGDDFCGDDTDVDDEDDNRSSIW